MAAPVEEEDGYEYVMLLLLRSCPVMYFRILTAFHSYESLPPNFSLAANMMAGAFAGIAVCIRRNPNISCPSLTWSRNIRSCFLLISLRFVFWQRIGRWISDGFPVDTNAASEPFSDRGLLRNIKCDGHNHTGGGV
jgi:hypothetical protein